MKTSIYIKKTVNIKKLYVKVYPRYIADSSVNGCRDLENDPKMPFVKFDDKVKEYFWEVNIDIDKGQIIDWPQGITASLHYKTCDEGFYEIFDEKGEKLGDYNGYVPHIMCPKEPGYGDYIIMDIDENGNIQNWDVEDDVIDNLLYNCGLKELPKCDY